MNIYMWQGYGHMGDWVWGAGLGIGWIFPLVFWVLVIWLIIHLVRSRNDHSTAEKGRQEDAMEILRKRYAKGEITKEQFEQMKKDLQ